MTHNIEEIWHKFHNKLKSFILSKVHDEFLADDLLQEVFIRVHTKMDTLSDENKIQSWIFQITNNLVMDHFRKNKKGLPVPDEKEEVVEEENEEVMAEAIDDMVKMMHELPAEYCEALCLTELQGMSQKEYAEKAGISHTLARTRAFRARKMLKEMLLKCCHYEFDRYGTVVDIQPSRCCCCCIDHCK
ncbi:MAG: RNA polymerase sigma factor SigZ [Bacteroidetes bacterium]|nr:RNA polymerase sigma factor SigZ [Bacteroidota bacterium]